MVKPKRMSDIFASSSEKDATILTATPPYSSEGPTLPILEGNANNVATDRDDTRDENQPQKTGNQNPQQPSLHPSLYAPWTLLPAELFSVLASDARLRIGVTTNTSKTANITSLAWTKNVAIKSGINKLKALLGFSLPSSQVSTQLTHSATHQDDHVIAISAHGEGTAKLVSIVDMTKRIVSRSEDTEGEREKVLWYMYISLSSIVVEKRQSKKTLEAIPGTARGVDIEDVDVDTMEIDESGVVKTKEEARTIKVPVLTIWMTRKVIPTFRDAFGEQTFNVQTLKSRGP